MRIRLATGNDADSIACVLREAFEAYRPYYTAKAFEATTPKPHQIRNRLKEGPIWIAARDSEIVGTVSGVSQGDAFYIRSMAVIPTARNLGIGQNLLHRAESYAMRRRFQLLTLNTTPFLKDAIRLYERCGFHFSTRDTADLFGTPLVTMTKTLLGIAPGDAAGHKK